jgi:hypothetical protein
MRQLLVLLTLLALPGTTDAAKARPARLVIDTPVDGATVEVDGKVVGKTPLTPVAITPGKHTVRVKKPGYLEVVEVVDAHAGATVRVAAHLLVAPAGGDADLDLVPLAPPPTKAVPTPRPPEERGARPDELDLEPLVSPELAPIGPTPPGLRPPAVPPPRPDFVSPPMITIAVPPESPDAWYRRPWVWGGAAAVALAAAGGVTWALTHRGGSSPCYDTWTLGQSGSFDPHGCR